MSWATSETAVSLSGAVLPAAVLAAASRRTRSSLTQPIYWSARAATAAWALARVAAIAALSLSRLLESLISGPIFAYLIGGYHYWGRGRGTRHQTGSHNPCPLSPTTTTRNGNT